MNYNVWKKDSRENHLHSEISFKIDGGNDSKSTKMNTLRKIENNKIQMNN